MKVCIRCKVPQSLEAFGTYTRYADGKHRYCRTCWNALVNARRRARGAKPIPPFLERLWEKIYQCGHEDMCVYCCWPWRGTQDKDGYGRLSLTYNDNHISIRTTRVMYELWHARPIPPGKMVCHHCDFPPCCNPLHLWLGTAKSNRQDAMRKHRIHHLWLPGEASPSAKLKNTQVHVIRQRYAQGDITMKRLAMEYGITAPRISLIIHRKTYKNVP